MAIATFSALVFLAFILHKTLSKRTPNPRKKPDRHKKKKRKPNHVSRSHRTRGGKGQRNKNVSNTVPESNETHVDGDEEEHCLETTKADSNPGLPALLEDKPLLSSESDSAFYHERSLEMEDEACRQRSISLSTTDTALPDDISYESTSSRSTPVPIAALEHPCMIPVENKVRTTTSTTPSRPAITIRSTPHRKPNARRSRKVSHPPLGATLPTAATTTASPARVERKWNTSGATWWETTKESRSSEKPSSTPSNTTTTNNNLDKPLLDPPSRLPQHQSAHSFQLQRYPSGNASSERGNEAPPMSPCTTSLFSCENGSSPWPRMSDTRVSPTPIARPVHTYMAPLDAYPRAPMLPPPPGLSLPSNPTHVNSFFSSTSDSLAVPTMSGPCSSLDRPVLRPPPGLAISTPLASSTPLTVPSLVAPPSSNAFTSASLWNETSVVKENPFAMDEDDIIEQELQELGGKMVGSILDF
jgi:hypothetical protein